MAEGTYKEDDEGVWRDGAWTFWHENGEKWADGTFTDGRRDGAWTFWYENGQKASEGTYIDGRRDKWTAWAEDGQVQWGWTNDRLPALPDVP